jgi:hypothetical protein
MGIQSLFVKVHVKGRLQVHGSLRHGPDFGWATATGLDVDSKRMHVRVDFQPEGGAHPSSFLARAHNLLTRTKICLLNLNPYATLLRTTGWRNKSLVFLEEEI